MVMRAFLLSVLMLAGCSSPAGRPHGPTARRIVSLLPSFTEILFDIGAGDRVVGRTTWCDYPPAALAVPSVGDGIPPDIEAVAARQPDLVVLSAQVSLEAIAARNPDWIAVLSDSSVMPGFAKRPEWQAVRAVRDRHFLLLPGSLFGHPGPRTAQAVSELQRLLRK